MVTYPVKLLIPDMNWEYVSNQRVIELFQDKMYITLIKDVKDFRGDFCYNFALGVGDDKVDDCESGHAFLETLYEPIPIKKAKVGDVISYYDGFPGEDTCQHFAIIEETDRTLSGTFILSKWGAWGVFLTDLYAMPDFYGDTIVIWRKK